MSSKFNSLAPQIDLPKNQRSGLFKALDILKNVDGIGTIFLNEGDVVRHRLVKSIVKAYEKADNDSTNIL